MSPELRLLLESVRDYRMTAEERHKQAVSFAYGNVRLDEPGVSREMVERAVRAAEEKCAR
jgi:hypothetical protein